MTFAYPLQTPAYPVQWRVAKRGNQTGIRMLAVTADTQGHVWEPRTNHFTERHVATAYLFAASPALLASLVEVMDAMDDGSDEPALIRARAAIASAQVPA